MNMEYCTALIVRAAGGFKLCVWGGGGRGGEGGEGEGGVGGAAMLAICVE